MSSKFDKIIEFSEFDGFNHILRTYSFMAHSSKVNNIASMGYRNIKRFNDATIQAFRPCLISSWYNATKNRRFMIHGQKIPISQLPLSSAHAYQIKVHPFSNSNIEYGSIWVNSFFISNLRVINKLAIEVFHNISGMGNSTY